MKFSNYHTHSVLCDGKNTLREMVESAISLGMPELGFSGHAFMEHDTSCCMSLEGTKEYCVEIKKLKKEFKDKIKIYCGLEQDTNSVAPQYKYDYLIGAVHDINKDGIYMSVDTSADIQKKAVFEHFGGDWYAYTDAFFDLESRVVDITNCNIVAHFDLVTKYNENNCLFDENNKRYRDSSVKALEKVAKNNVIFEINTGAISRNCRTTPYPAPFLLQELKRLNKPVILSSDSHSKDTIIYGFDDALELAKKYKLEIITDMEQIIKYTK